MATYTIIKLTHMSPLHVGTGKENYDFSANTLKSDTLSAALAAIRAQQGKTEDIDTFLQSFTISTAFPFYKEILFMPKMQGFKLSVRGDVNNEHRKILKKIQYIEFEIWQQLIEGKEIVLDSKQILGTYVVKDSAEFVISKCQTNERVSVPRDGISEAVPYFFEWQYFSPNAGLFCLTSATGELLSELIELFTILGEQGIGTDRSVGGGRFCVDASTKLNISEAHNSGKQMLLSMYIPTQEELDRIDLNHSTYELSMRGGYIAGSCYENLRHLRKRLVYMFETGSVLSTEVPLQGKIVDLKPIWNDESMHPVYRSGKPLSIFVR